MSLCTKEPQSYLQGLLVHVEVICSIHLPGLAEQDEVFEEGYMPERLLPSPADKELPTLQLPLLLSPQARTAFLGTRLPSGDKTCRWHMPSSLGGPGSPKEQVLALAPAPLP